MTERILYFDVIKALALIGVVTIHVSALGVATEPILSNNWFVSLSYDSLAHCSVPLFCMVTGALFLSSDKQRTVTIKHIKRILYALIIYRLFYAILFSISESPQFSMGVIKKIAVYFLLTEDHTWYLFMLLGFYLLHPILKSITSSESSERRFLLLWLLVSALLIIETIPKFGCVPKFFLESFHLDVVTGLTGYFILGRFLHVRELKINANRIILFLVLLGGVFIIIIGTSFLSAYQNVIVRTFYDYYSFFVVLISISVFCLIKQCDLNKMPHLLMRVCTALSKYSLGIYLIHVFYLYIFRQLGINYGFITPLIGIPLIVVVSVVLSYITILLMSKNTFLRQLT